MPFTESELRAMLEDNSAEVPPIPDLATIAETRGKKIRRRQAAGATATAAVVAISALALPWFLKNDHPAKAQVVVAAKPSSAQSGSADVDYSVFKSVPAPSILQAVKAREALGDKLTDNRGMPFVINFHPAGVAGTVAGFDALPLDPAKAGSAAAPEVVMKIRVSRSFKAPDDPSDSRHPLLPAEDEIISVHVGSRTPVGRYRKAVPAGVRLVAFWVPFLYDDLSGDKLPTFDPAMLIFEKADGSLIGGPYQTGQVPSPWNRVKTMDELIALTPKLSFPCLSSDPRTGATTKKSGASPEVVLSQLLKECARSGADPSKAPLPTP
jgi:hypothetical protein